MRLTGLLLGAAAVVTLAGVRLGRARRHGAAHRDRQPGASGGRGKCKPNLQTDADEIRQAICRNGDGRFILATFATDRGQREWINDAKDYGGHYLVGRKWVAVGDDGVVKAARHARRRPGGRRRPPRAHRLSHVQGDEGR